MDALQSKVIWTPRRQELLAWFKRDATVLAGAYEGAVELLGNTHFPGRIHLIAHAVRDIANGLPEVLDGKLKSKRIQYEACLDEVMADWPTGARIDEDSSLPPNADVAIPRIVFAELDKLIAAHRARRELPNNSTLLFRILLGQEDVEVAESDRVVKAFEVERKWFTAIAHFPRKLTDPPVDLKLHFERFENMLHSFVGNFFTGTSTLDAILQDTNSRTD